MSDWKTPLRPFDLSPYLNGRHWSVFSAVVTHGVDTITREGYLDNCIQVVKEGDEVIIQNRKDDNWARIHLVVNNVDKEARHVDFRIVQILSDKEVEVWE